MFGGRYYARNLAKVVQNVRMEQWERCRMPDGKRKPKPKKPAWDSAGMSLRAKAHFDKYVRWIKDDMSVHRNDTTRIFSVGFVAGDAQVVTSKHGNLRPKPCTCFVQLA